MPDAVFDHVALHVADVATAERFYREVLGLAPLERPAFDFPGAWLAIGQAHQLHLIGGRQQAPTSHSRGTHFALRVDDMDAWVARLESHGAEFHGPRRRPDGFAQVFVVDPDGHWVELNRPPD